MIIVWLLGIVILVSFGLIVFRGAPYVPTHRAQIRAVFLRLYPLSKRDVVLDLGSGDGVVLKEAAATGAKAIGYELNPFLVLVSRLRFRHEPKVKVYLKDYLRIDTLPKDVTVVYAFTTGHTIEAIGKKLEQWSSERELRFISYGFTLSDRKPERSLGAMHLYRYTPKA